jgi:hypothetical protein
MEEGQAMSDVIDSRFDELLAYIDGYYAGPATELAAELTRQLLPPDARERIARWICRTQNRSLTWDALTESRRAQFYVEADSLLAALSATSPEAAAECQTVVTMTMEPGTLTEAKATELAEAFTNYINAVGERDGVTFTVGTPQYVDDGIDEVRFVIGTGKVTGR